MGFADSVEDESIWNDAHTATLEDYGIHEGTSPLYTQEAKEAGNRQEYKDAMEELK
ncbi:hypothetical protein D3C78_1905590 [compost metagenome]